MKTSTITLIIIAVVAIIAVLQLNITGMATQEVNLKYYPSFFGPDFDAYVIKGKIKSPEEMMAANIIVSRLPEQYEMIRQALYQYGIPQGRMTAQDLQYKVVNEVDTDYTQNNAILVGSICHNSDIAHLLGVIDCMSFFKPGEGMVKLVEANDKYYVIFTGYTGDEVLAVTRAFLSELQLNKIDSKEFKIDSTTQIPLRDPQWYGEYTTTPSVRSTRSRDVNVLGSTFYLGNQFR